MVTSSLWLETRFAFLSPYPTSEATTGSSCSSVTQQLTARALGGGGGDGISGAAAIRWLKLRRGSEPTVCGESEEGGVGEKEARSKRMNKIRRELGRLTSHPDGASRWNQRERLANRERGAGVLPPVLVPDRHNTLPPQRPPGGVRASVQGTRPSGNFSDAIALTRHTSSRHLQCLDMRLCVPPLSTPSPMCTQSSIADLDLARRGDKTRRRHAPPKKRYSTSSWGFPCNLLLERQTW